MDKKRVEALIPLAYDAIRTSGISDQEGKVPKSYRGQISTFGAAVTMGSLLAAIAFFSTAKNEEGKPEEKSEPDVDRTKLLKAIFETLKQDGAIPNAAALEEKNAPLYHWAREQLYPNGLRADQYETLRRERACRENVLEAAVAVKLALNLYILVKDEGRSQ